MGIAGPHPGGAPARRRKRCPTGAGAPTPRGGGGVGVQRDPAHRLGKVFGVVPVVSKWYHCRRATHVHMLSCISLALALVMPLSSPSAWRRRPAAHVRVRMSAHWDEFVRMGGRPADFGAFLAAQEAREAKAAQEAREAAETRDSADSTSYSDYLAARDAGTVQGGSTAEAVAAMIEFEKYDLDFDGGDSGGGSVGDGEISLEEEEGGIRGKADHLANGYAAAKIASITEDDRRHPIAAYGPYMASLQTVEATTVGLAGSMKFVLSSSRTGTTSSRWRQLTVAAGRAWSTAPDRWRAATRRATSSRAQPPCRGWTHPQSRSATSPATWQG